VASCRACGNQRLKRKVWEENLAEELALAEERRSRDEAE
jgi:hypothetical protein